ncbi:hypothetical protein F4604DRAFT_1685775 [Suillus subluteus]|nr:hypothetical protein F4604DRAFT_1685775 [Suillus subluteus]
MTLRELRCHKNCTAQFWKRRVERLRRVSTESLGDLEFGWWTLNSPSNYLVNRSRVAITEAKRLASVSALSDAAVSPTSGLCLTEMRTHLFAPTTIEVSLLEISSPEHPAGKLHEGLNQRVRRRQVLDVLSLDALPPMSAVSTDLERDGISTHGERKGLVRLLLHSHACLVCFADSMGRKSGLTQAASGPNVMLGCPVSSRAFPMTTLSVLEHSKHEPLEVAMRLFLRPNRPRDRLAEYSQEETDLLLTKLFFHEAWGFEPLAIHSTVLYDISVFYLKQNTKICHWVPQNFSDDLMFQSQVSKVDDLTAILEIGDPSSFARESVIEESISGFVNGWTISMQILSITLTKRYCSAPSGTNF